MRECPLSRHLGMEAPASPVPPTLAGAFHFGSRRFFHCSKAGMRSKAILALSLLISG
jgi:hypothetical protein